MLIINAIGSSSSGNSFVIRDGSSTILLDAGCKTEDIAAGLFKLNINRSDINGVLITHSHQDHIQGVHAVMSCKKYMTKGTFNSIEFKNKLRKEDIEIIKSKEVFNVGTFIIKAFPTKHDADESVGFIVMNITGEKLLYMTDTGIANVNFKNADAYIIEANHSEKFLSNEYEKGNLDKVRYDRIKDNHLSSEQSIAYLKRNMGDKTKKVILMHLSPRNKNPIGVMNYARAMLNSRIIDFVHPVSHNVEKE